MIVTSMQPKISSRRDIAVLRKESSSFEGEEDVKGDLTLRVAGDGKRRAIKHSAVYTGSLL
jgi:hypothetical protein